MIDCGYITSLKPEGAQYVRGARIATEKTYGVDYTRWNLYWAKKITFVNRASYNFILPEIECQKETGRTARLSNAQKDILDKYESATIIPWHDLRNLPLVRTAAVVTKEKREPDAKPYISFE